MLLLPADEIEEFILQPERRNAELIPDERLRIAGQHIEHCGRVLSHKLRAGQESDIRVQLCRRIIIVSRSEVHIAPDAVFLPPHDESNLAVRFQPDKTVDDMAARLLQHFRPDDIIFLIEARLELDEHSHLLTVFRRLCQCRDNR